MGNLVLEDGTGDRRHKAVLGKLLREFRGRIRITSPYITERESLVSRKKLSKCQLLTSLAVEDIVFGATNLEAMNSLLTAGVEIRSLPSTPKIHAKVYVFGNEKAVITSANLTTRAFTSNIEAGSMVEKSDLPELVAWFDNLWEQAVNVNVKTIAALKKSTSKLRDEIAALRRKSRSVAQNLAPSTRAREPLSDVLRNTYQRALKGASEEATQFFVCNTNRKNGVRTATGGYGCEEVMHARGYAAAWLGFDHQSHMERVKPDDIIFAFAKGFGIIGIGVAQGPIEKLGRRDKGKLTPYFANEWRIKTKWLAWTDDKNAYGWKSNNCTFWDVSGPEHAEMHREVFEHFSNLE